MGPTSFGANKLKGQKPALPVLCPGRELQVKVLRKKGWSGEAHALHVNRTENKRGGA